MSAPTPEGVRRSTRQRIIEAATVLFATKGIAGTKVADIEAEVGLAVGTGSFHRHFKNKDELLDAVVEHALSGPGLPALGVGDDLDGLASRIAQVLAWLDEHAMAIALVGRIRAERPELARSLHAGFRSWVTPNADGPDARATVITSAVIGFNVSKQVFGQLPGNLDATEFAHILAAMAANLPLSFARPDA